MSKITDKVAGSMEQKRKYKENEKRAEALPKEFAEAYKAIRNYLWDTAGIVNVEPLVALVDMFEEAAANGKKVKDITGEDVAAFADEFVKGEK